MKAFLSKLLNFLKFFGTLICNYVCKKKKVINNTVSLDLNHDGKEDISIQIKTELHDNDVVERDITNSQEEVKDD